MYSGFEFNQDTKPQTVEHPHKRLNEAAKPFSVPAEHKHVYNFKAPPFEEAGEGFSIPPQILELFDAKDKAILEHKQKGASRTSVTSHSTIDSRVGQNVGNTGGNVTQSNRDRIPSFNTLLNQSNDFEAIKHGMGDLNTSGLSQNLNNISRDSNLNTSSRRNTSSRANAKASKNYQVTLNEDISLIERIEIMLNQITMNHNKTCPFCSKNIDIKKSNFQNISALHSDTSKRYYLTHFDCYLKASSNHATTKIMPLSNAVEAKVNLQINSLHTIDTSNFLRSDRRAYFVSIEGYHPISSYLFFKIDKICHGLEHATHRNQLLYLNLATKSTSIFEPASYTIPFSEFRLVVTVHLSHGNEDPFTYEYLVDFSQAKVSAEQKSRFAEVTCSQEGNSIIIGSQIVFDPNAAPASTEVGSKANLDSSFQSTSSTTSSKPDFGKNVFIILKQFSISLPLKRIERKAKETVMAPIVEENHLMQQLKQTQATPVAAAQKKPHTRLQLNPNAPLFGTPSAQTEQAGAHQFLPQGQTQGDFNKQSQQPPSKSEMFLPQGFQQGQQSHEQPSSSSQQSQYQGFNFIPDFSRGQGQGSQQPQNQYQGQQQPQGPSQSEMMPPGLGIGQGNRNQINYPYFPQQMFNQQGGEISQKNVPFRFDEQTEQRPGQQSDMNFDKGGYNLGEETQYQNPDTYQPDKNLERRGNRPPNLYTAVLSGRKMDDSATNSPSVLTMQNRFFSAAPTPTSEFDQAPILNSPNDFLTGSEEEGPANPPLSEEMVESFRLEDHLGELVEFAKTYNGSRILQKFFPKANQDEVDLIIHEIQDKLEELMLDPYANYMFQTLAQSCSSDQRYFLLKKISPSMVEIACDRKGTHALQSLIALVSRDAEENLLKDTLKDHIVELSFDPQGTHLVQRLIVSISINNISFIFEPLVQRFVEVANHSFGLCVLKQLITKVESAPELRKRLVKLLYDNLENLIQNPYGNYALQHALDAYQQECSVLFEKTFDRIVQYSNQKFSSNVIEKCLVVASPEYKKAFVKELTKGDRMAELMKNKYGNFVLLKALKSVGTDDRQIIMQALVKNLNSVSMAKYKNSWAKFIEENPLKVPGGGPQVKHSIFRQNSGPQFENAGNESWGDAKLQKGGPKSGGGEFGQENRILKENMQAQQFGGKKVGNQKFYDDKSQHNPNKWGFNNF